jgi:hypothetical protein
VVATTFGRSQAVDWINPVTQYSADNTGATDTGAAIQNAIAALPSGGGTVYLPAGTYLMNSSAVLSLATAGTRLMGAGPKATTLKIGASFSGAEVINVASHDITVRDLAIVGASSTISSNPACNGIEIQSGSYQYRLQNLFMQYVNGYALEAKNANAQPAISHSILEDAVFYNCAGGIHYNGNQATVGCAWNNILVGNGGTGTGPNANLDAVKIEDAFDITWTNGGVGTGNAGTGHGIHLYGNCANIWVDNVDCGGFPTPLAASQRGILIEDGPNGHSSLIRFAQGVYQTFGVGAEVAGSARDVMFTGCTFNNNITHGVVLSGTGDQINFHDCSWSGNGSGASGTNYDVNATGSPNGWARNCHFNTAIVSTGNAGVQNVGAHSAGNFLYDWCEFLGSGTGLSTAFNGLPAKVRRCKNYNPHGSQTVTVPASGVATAALHYDAWFYITAADTGPGEYLCTPTQYAPGTQTTLTCNTTGFTAFSSANVNTGNFTAPASGSVLVTASFMWQISSSSQSAEIGLCAHGTTTPMMANIIEFKASGANIPVPGTAQFLVTGLTPGSTYNFDLMGCATSTFSVSIIAFGQTSTSPTQGNSGVGGPVVMSVQSIGTSGGCTIVRNANGQGGGTGPTITIAPGQTVPVMVAAQQTITPTYTDAPTWVVDGL